MDKVEKCPVFIQLDSGAAEPRFLRHTFEVEDRSLEVVKAKFKMTAVYRPVSFAMESGKADPAIGLEIAFSWCNMFGDLFTRQQGRNKAMDRLRAKHTILVPVYVGQTIFDALVKRIAKLDTARAFEIGIPDVIYRKLRAEYGRRLPKQTHDTEVRRSRSKSDRYLYSVKIAQGQTREEAIQAVRCRDCER